MTKSTSYLDNGVWHQAYKHQMDGDVFVLVKADNGSRIIIRFDKTTGRVKRQIKTVA